MGSQLSALSLRAGRGCHGSGKKQAWGQLWVTEHPPPGGSCCPHRAGRITVSPKTSEEFEPAWPVEGSGLGGGSAPSRASSLQHSE